MSDVDEHDDVPLAQVIAHPSADPRTRLFNEHEGALDELPVRTQPRPALDTCRHRRTWVDESARKLTCRDCDVEVDPIAVLVGLARDREFWAGQARWLRLDAKRAERDLEELKRQERNAKSRIRTARKRRNDEHALIAAATVAGGLGGYRPWDQLSEPQRVVVLTRVRTIIEAYAGALEATDAHEEQSA